MALILDDPDINGIRERLAPVLTGCELAEKDGHLLVKAADDAQTPAIYRKIIEAGILPHSIRVNEKTAGNAYEELMRRNDLSEQLF